MRYRLLAPSGEELESGEGQARVEGGALVVTPSLGQPLRIRPPDVVSTSEPAPYVVAMTLAEGPTLELSQLGALRTQVLSDFATVRADATVHTMLLSGLGTPAKYPGAVGGVDAELRLYDDVLVLLPSSGEPDQLRYSFIDDIATDPSGYRITVSSSGREPVVLQRLATRTSEFIAALHDRVNKARLRSAATINVLLPGLGSLASRSVSGMLRDGVPAALTALDRVEPTVSTSLLRAATLPARTGCVSELQRRGSMWFAIHQRTSVEVAATGGNDLSAAPVEVHRDHGGIGAAPGGLAGVAAGTVLGAGPDLFGIGAFSGGGAFGGGPLGSPIVGAAMLTGGMGGGGGGLLGSVAPPGGTAPDRHQERAVPKSGSADVAHTDYDQLGTSGDEPTVLGMTYTAIPEHGALVYEVLNDRDHATYVYDLPPGEPDVAVRSMARALALIGFRVSAVYSDASGVDSELRDAVQRLPYLSALRGRFRGRAIHTDGWAAQLDGLISR